MKLVVALASCLIFACNEGTTTRFIIPAIPDPGPLNLAELFDVGFPLSIQFANTPPLDPLWAAFEGDLSIDFHAPALDGGPFADLTFDQGLGGIPTTCMATTGLGPYDYDVVTGTIIADVNLDAATGTILSFTGTIQKTFFLERLPDVIEVLADETVTVVEYVLLSRIVGSGAWTFSALDATCPALPGPNAGPWSIDVAETLPDPGGEGDPPLMILGVQHVAVLGADGELLGEATTEYVAEVPTDG